MEKQKEKKQEEDEDEEEEKLSLDLWMGQAGGRDEVEQKPEEARQDRSRPNAMQTTHTKHKREWNNIYSQS